MQLRTEIEARNRNWLKRLTPLIVRSQKRKLEKLGSEYGGWFVPIDLINSDWICYCAGVGEDITFDLALMQRFNCQVYAFDPTPRAIQHVHMQAGVIPPGFHFEDIGLWSDDRLMRFYAPADSSHVSYSIVNLQSTDSYFEARCKSLKTIMREHGHQQINLLKLDIEGAQYEVLASMLKHGIKPKVLCVEYDQPTSTMQMLCSIGQLLLHGYQLLHIDNFNLTFVL
jgi:FkbM family methyltransferase